MPTLLKRPRLVVAVALLLLAGSGLSRIPAGASQILDTFQRPTGAGPEVPEPGLLFYLSGDRGLAADYAAGGDPQPNFASDVRIIADGAKGPAIECGHTQLLSYWAPGNVYAERGTLSFFWRSREAVGRTEFPLFRIGYADHSSWDMVWLRIDYNGKPGFDAFVTDASLARTRVSYTMPAFPGPKSWIHLTLSWDETRGIRFYVNGEMVAKKDGATILFASLDQFGPHSRIISPMQVQSAYNFVRGGDIDELRIYDRQLSDDNIRALARGEAPSAIPPVARSLDRPEWRDEWWYRYGWNRPGDVPPPVEPRAVRIRKVAIHDVYDLKRWWGKATDGVRETTWPGVYNRSRLEGRNDYFQLPDWDCYSLSGKSVRFTLPDEPWNQVEVSGAAWGQAELVGGDGTGPGTPLFERPKGQERTFHRLVNEVRGQAIRFTNVEQETPIGELAAYRVSPGPEPDGIARLTYRLTASGVPTQAGLEKLVDFIRGRYPADERTTMVALPPGSARLARGQVVNRLSSRDLAPVSGGEQPGDSRPDPKDLPIVHILVPADARDIGSGAARASFTYSWTNLGGGLDGIAVDLPALGVRPTHGAFFPLNIQVKDPLWPLRNLMDVSVAVRPGEAHTLWLDTRDRILPNNTPLYLTIAGAGADFGPSALEGAELRLVFKARKEAATEHVLDRFTEARTTYAHIVEERPLTHRLGLYNRFEQDLTDLLRVDPDHFLGRCYWYDYNREQPPPPVTLAPPPPGVPAWAFRQVEHLKSVKRLVNWYIDNRQIENGEFGGGLSDDGDFTNYWPPAAFMGANPGKIRRSLLREMEAFYEQGMFTNGLSTIQTDELHSYEEGIDVLGQAMLLDYGNPKHLERAMETARASEGLTGVNAAGHRHIRSAYFSGTKMSEEGVWGWAKGQSYLLLHPSLALVEFNGSPRVRRWVLELVDGLLAHRRQEASGAWSLRPAVEFATDRDLPGQGERVWPLFWAAFKWTGDKKYLQPFMDAGPRSLGSISGNALDLLGLRATWGPEVLSLAGPESRDNALRHLAWQLTGDAAYLEGLYADQEKAARRREYINTEGSLWIDRVNVADAELQRARLGGVALVRNSIYPGHAVSWEFAGPDAEEQVAILVLDATPRHRTILAYNLDASAVTARMTAWDIEPGRWKMTEGTGSEAGAAATGPAPPAVRDARTRTIDLERAAAVEVTFGPRALTAIAMDLVSPATPYWSRPDLGISADDVRVEGGIVKVTVHSLGARDVPPSRVVLRDRGGRELASAPTPALKAPDDLVPKRAEVRLAPAAGARWEGGTISVEPPPSVREITMRNNRIELGEQARRTRSD